MNSTQTSHRYPLVAIPSDVFDALHQKVEAETEDGKIFSVNEYLQSIIRHAPMYDYLLRKPVVQRKLEADPYGKPKWMGDYQLSEPKVIGEQYEAEVGEPLRKVRVTEDEFRLLQIRQEQYRSDGYRIPISCILTSLLFQYSQRVRNYVYHSVATYVRPYGDNIDYHAYAQAWQLTEKGWTRVKLVFFDKDDSGHWQTYSYQTEDEQRLNVPSVDVGWKPQRV